MPLRSRLFADNAALQSCLVSNAAHIAPGARGEHVTLIQSALVRLRVLDPIDPAPFAPNDVDGFMRATREAMAAVKAEFEGRNPKEVVE